MNQMTRRGPRWLKGDAFGTPDQRFLAPGKIDARFSEGVPTVTAAGGGGRSDRQSGGERQSQRPE